MTRRHFLKTLALTTMAAVVVAAPSSLSASTRSAATALAGQSGLNGTLFAGTREGRILTSHDGGQTWLPRANFGSHCSVLSVVLHQEKLVATIAVQGFTFQLTSSDGHVWRTIA